jgi:hypothetical protein
LFKAKKSEIHRRAKRLLSAFSNEARRESLESIAHGQRKLIRAHYEKGLLVVKEDFVRLPSDSRQIAHIQFQIIDDLLSILKNGPRKKRVNEFK